MPATAPSDPDAEELGEQADAAVGSSGAFARARRDLHVPRGVLRIVLRDPQHVPERLTIYAVDKQASAAREWAQRVRAAEPESSPAVIADKERRRTISTARIDGAIAGTPFFIALVPAYIAFLRQELRFHLRTAALYGRDPADPEVAADFLVLRGVRKTPELALAELAKVRATPLPEHGEHTPIRSWFEAVENVLVLAGFLSAPTDDGPKQLSVWARFARVVRVAAAVAIWALTWIVPVTFMIVMAWGCENDARRFGQRVLTRYGEEGDDIAVSMTRADRKAGGHRALTVVRGVLVVVSIALPLALIAATILNGSGPLGVHVPQAVGSLVALALVIGASVAAVRG